MISVKRLALAAAVAAGLAFSGISAASIATAAEGPVVVFLQAEPVSLDPMFTQSDAYTILSIHEGLFRLDNDGKIVPAVAELITNVDPLTWEVKIRQGLAFHNDEPINADAVVFTFDRAKKLFAAGKGDLTFASGPQIRPGGEDRRLHRAHQDEGAGPDHHLPPRQSGILDPAAQVLFRATRRRRWLSPPSAPAATSSSPTRREKGWC